MWWHKRPLGWLTLLLLWLGWRWPDRRGSRFGAYAIGSGEDYFALAHFRAFPISGELDGDEHTGLRDVEFVTNIEELPHLVEGDGGRGDGVPQSFLESGVGAEFLAEGGKGTWHGLLTCQVGFADFS